MGLRSAIAGFAGRACLRVLRDGLHRNASTLPGRVALALDPDILVALGSKPEKGCIVVCGTNGKTTTTNVLAHAVESGGMTVLCNWAGANMESGVACALLPQKATEWGIFENDELSTVHVVPKLHPSALLLLNLFRDQLDRCGEIDHVQDVITQAVEESPETVLIYDADDPLCRGIARNLELAGHRCISFGIARDLGIQSDRVRGGGFCQACGAPLTYEFRQYGQLGKYACPACDFRRPELDYAAENVEVGSEGIRFDVVGPDGNIEGDVKAGWGGAYMVYNLLGAYVAARIAGITPTAFQSAIDGYNPKNGRLQRFDVGGRIVTLNLAKNPTGFNQNMSLLMNDPAPKAVYIVINDDYNDGRDVSWLWDVDFERLNSAGETVIFAGGHRANDMQVRLKYAGVGAEISPDVCDFLKRCESLPPSWHIWVLTNYSALWPVKADLERIGDAR